MAKRQKKTINPIISALIFIGKPILQTVTLLVGLLIRLTEIKKLKKVKLRIKWKFKFPKTNFRFLKIPKLRLPVFGLKKRLLIPLVLLVFSTISILFWVYIIKDLPNINTLITRNVEVSTKIYDRNGVLLYKIYKNKNRTLVPLDMIPPQVRLATLAAEDAEFYDHPGISIRGILRSILRNVTRGGLSGGSTITQQLVKNALLTPEKTLTRKIKEVVLALEVEHTFTKDQILEMYLNEVSYGGTAYGIAEASQMYFSKTPEELSLTQAAYLAGLPKKPTEYSFFSPTPQEGIDRQKEVLNLMKINRFITDEQLTQALSENLTFSDNKIDIKAPHFVMYVKQQLEEKYGGQTVEQGGLEVITTLDYKIQYLAENVLKSELEKVRNLHVSNGAVVVLDPRSGEILAMVGSKDYFDIKNDGNVNVTTSIRQPGSSIKIIDYAYALEHGYTPASIIDDSPISFKIPGSSVYVPKNYDGKYRGKISLRNAFAESRNIPAVKVLASYGVEKMIDLGEKMGITTWQDRSRFGLSLALGGGETKLVELANAYATVANQGRKLDLKSVLEVADYKGKKLDQDRCKKTDGQQVSETVGGQTCANKQVIDERVAYMLTDILKDNGARAASFGTNSQLVIPNHPEVAVKTGTSNDLRDNLTVGYSQDYLVAVWVGNNDNTPMNRIASGITGAAPIFNKIMTGILANKKSVDWTIPEGLVKLPICTYTGTLPCQNCPTRYELFLKENQPKRYCSSEQIQKIIDNKILDGISTQN